MNLYDMFMHFTSVVNEKGSNKEKEDQTVLNKNTKKSPKKGKNSDGGTLNMDQKSNDVLM